MTTTTMEHSSEPFRIGTPGLLGRLAGPAERALAFPELNRVYADTTKGRGAGGFSDRALGALDVRLGVSDTDLARVPTDGPLVVVANHPFGAVDGLALLTLLKRVRPDVKVMANSLLARVPELRDLLILVDPYEGEGARQRNAAPLREALGWLKQGGVLGVFPAGEVSHLDWRSREVADVEWNPAVVRLIKRTGAAVLPVFFEGRNSNWFQVLGMVHPRVRTVMLPRELLRRRGSEVRVQVGSVIPAARLARFEDPREAAAYLRVRTYVLKGRTAGHVARQRVRVDDPLAAAESAEMMAAEVGRLGEERRIGESGKLSVHWARAVEISAVLREIGRLREETFRGVGEATGKPRDLDWFDEHYVHLFVWNGERREVVGSYRLGLTDEVVSRFGADGLYTSTLFKYRQKLLDELTPGIELGRSFVRREYQKEYAPLLLLWKGIGGFVARHPRYRMLFGPVSISNEYRSLSKVVLMRFLEMNGRVSRLAKWVMGRNPPRFGTARDLGALAGTVVGSIEEVDELVVEIESDRRRVPVLVRQYLKLGAKLLGFNVDPEFGDVLDGLMLVDLMKVDPVVLKKYLGTEGVEALYREHR